jgi:hypothetical protein
MSNDTSVLVADAVEEGDEVPTSITLSTGVKLRIKQAALGILMKVMARYERPEVYTFYVEEEKRWFENPDHPDYIDAVKAYEAKTNDVLLNAIILLSTELDSKPKDMPGHMSNGWLELFEALDLEVKRDNKSWRYLNWVLMNAIVTQDDFALITEIAELSGIALSEEAVEKAANFPGSD